jgi:hypothetical protein
MIDRLLHGTMLSDVKSEGDESREELDRKIGQTQAAADAVVAKAHVEIAHSQKIIMVAEQAIRSLKQAERHR